MENRISPLWINPSSGFPLIRFRTWTHRNEIISAIIQKYRKDNEWHYELFTNTRVSNGTQSRVVAEGSLDYLIGYAQGEYGISDVEYIAKELNLTKHDLITNEKR